MDFAFARRRMIDNQILPNRVIDPRLIAALGEVPREAFVPKALRGVAYVDEDIPIGQGRFLIEPLVLARLLQAAEIGPADVVLDIGCATGYSSAVIARIANAVVAVECDPSLARTATAALGQLGIDTVAVVEGRLEDGYPKQAPYDVIVVGGGVAAVPRPITDQLAEGGRLVAVVVAGGVGKGVVLLRRSGVVSRREVFDAATPVLPGFAPKATFAF